MNHEHGAVSNIPSIGGGEEETTKNDSNCSCDGQDLAESSSSSSSSSSLSSLSQYLTPTATTTTTTTATATATATTTATTAIRTTERTITTRTRSAGKERNSVSIAATADNDCGAVTCSSMMTPKRDQLQTIIDVDNDEDSDQDEDEDDEVEFLLTVLPLSPKRQKTTATATKLSPPPHVTPSTALKSTLIQDKQNPIKLHEQQQRRCYNSKEPPPPLQITNSQNIRCNGNDDNDNHSDDDEDMLLIDLVKKESNNLPSKRLFQPDSIEQSQQSLSDTTLMSKSSTATNVNTQQTVRKDTKQALETECPAEQRAFDETDNSMKHSSTNIPMTHPIPPSPDKFTKHDNLMAPPPSSPYPPAASAYVQNLAEICHTVMMDARWRGKKDGQPLFAWQNGDDLAAVLYLKDMYSHQPQLTPPQSKTINNECVCLLCWDFQSDPEAHFQNQQQPEGNCDSTVDTINLDHSSNTPPSSSPDTEVDNDHARAIHLYCRFFYRKGPWFRMDDIFTKYYAPKKLSQKQEECSDITTPQNTEQKTASSSSPQVIDNDTFQLAIQKMLEMCQDLEYLVSIGLLRSFHDEVECGKTAGAVFCDSTAGILLNADERREVLSKLGGGNSKKAASLHQRNPDPSKDNQEHPNKIWEQMSKQTSIAKMFSGESKSRHLLPVLKHVNKAILSKLLSGVVLSASHVKYIPSDILRSKLFEVRRALESRGNRSEGCPAGLPTETSFRLREAPLLSLRRVVRLYLCATSGPGNMRGDGTNGWKSLRSLEHHRVFPMARYVSPPSSNSWNSTIYPGLNERFGLSSYGFVNSYKEVLKVTKLNITQHYSVFNDQKALRLWELCVELRAVVDYLMELNELQLWHKRRQGREAEQNGIPSNGDDHDVDVNVHTLDFFSVLDIDGRENLIAELCQVGDNGVGMDSCDEVCASVDSDLDLASQCMEESHELTKSENVMFVIAVIVTHVLRAQYAGAREQDILEKIKKPWHRHLWPEGVMAYILWDCIPIMEKRGFYEMATKSLEILSFGKIQPRSWKTVGTTQTNFSWGEAQFVGNEEAPFCHVLTSRRARGKAIERIIIDYTHLLRREDKAEEVKRKKLVQASSKQKLRKAAQPKKPNANDRVNVLVKEVLPRMSKGAFLSFAAIRALAKRLKQPLRETLQPIGCQEAVVLGLRLDNNGVGSDHAKKRYIDWTPPTDEAVALAIAPENMAAVGKRCSYVGFEDGEKVDQVAPSSLNVEQLALEYYASGRLPQNNPELSGGGWNGWHDEGGHLRALFRIFCSVPLLGMDDGCGGEDENEDELVVSSNQSSVHLTKYQGAPFDLHVGPTFSESGNGLVGFYNRRKDRIELFLTKLEALTPQQLCDGVYLSVAQRYHMCKKRLTISETALLRDLERVRTLSILAAGFGGKQLAAAFRCMVFDYRHYSGGLPDLLLTRAKFADSSSDLELVDLGEWVGESFSPEAVTQQHIERGASMLMDQDEEFLGCTKVGDSGGRGVRSRRSQKQRAPPVGSEVRKVLPPLPKRVQLEFDGRPVQVQCMFVEVKSSNDRLDGRQEDWLNVLDRNGFARVCKFTDNKKNRKSK